MSVFPIHDPNYPNAVDTKAEKLKGTVQDYASIENGLWIFSEFSEDYAWRRDFLVVDTTDNKTIKISQEDRNDDGGPCDYEVKLSRLDVLRLRNQLTEWFNRG